jgi:uncharacterized protein
MDDAGPRLAVQVLYALPAEQIIVELDFEPALTAGQAARRSGLIERFSKIDAGPLILGVWGVEVAENFALRPGDRVEISRPLGADPRDMRREFLTAGKVMGGASAPPPQIRTTARR